MTGYTRTLLMLIFIIWGCSRSEEPADQENQTDAEELIRIARDRMDEIGLETGPIGTGTISEGIQVNGYLDTPPQYKAMVNSIVSGRVTHIRFLPGDHVNKKQEVIRLESPEFLELQQRFLESQNELRYLEDEYQRQKTLSENNVNARKTFLQAERDYQNKLTEIATLKHQLSLLNINADQLSWEKLSAILKISSPIDGYISKIETRMGEFIHPEDELFRVVNPAHLHAELNVFEKDFFKVREGQQVELRLSQAPDTLYYGEIFLVNKEMDMEKRSVNIHVHLPENPEWILGMYVEGRILSDLEEVLVIPSTALIREARGSFIYIVEREDAEYIYLRKTEVGTGDEQRDRIEISLPEGIPSDTRIALKGIYYLSTQ